MPLEKLLTINDLAEILGRTAGTIKNQHSKTPFKLPPVCRIPGAGRLLWRKEDVESWLQQHVAQHDIPIPTEKRKPGRPRKSLAVVSGGALRHV
ncbi:helix-turn-helix transcriptional regulator [uncultured Pseudomonas sp.]|uniref:helix-turn-helix transcriptional regulator n=1 Tax=uncultured Pseudomonas sp. TaxID=114707 RepID=UPI0025EA2A8A|nr:helix-turn-helix domain-containing protein [uncultured Pseudomonas sp.]